MTKVMLDALHQCVMTFDLSSSGSLPVSLLDSLSLPPGSSLYLPLSISLSLDLASGWLVSRSWMTGGMA